MESFCVPPLRCDQNRRRFQGHSSTGSVGDIVDFLVQSPVTVIRLLGVLLADWDFTGSSGVVATAAWLTYSRTWGV